MKNVLVLFMILLISPAFCQSAAEVPKLEYFAPADVWVKIQKLESRTGNELPSLEAHLKSLLGTPKDFELVFVSSPDFQIDPKSEIIKALPQGEEKTIPIRLSRGKGVPDKSGSWVRLQVKYKPDFNALYQKIEAEKQTSFPVDHLREQLKETLKRVENAGMPFTTTTACFPFDLDQIKALEKKLDRLKK